MSDRDRDTSWDDVFVFLLLWLVGIVLCLVLFAVLFVAMALEQENITQTSGEENFGYYTDANSDTEASKSMDFFFPEKIAGETGL